MRILIEEYQYKAALIKDVLYGIIPVSQIEERVSVSYVGYFYNNKLQDCVFILPKVLLKASEEPGNKQDLVFGRHKPEDIINLTEKNPLRQSEVDFIYKFAVWIYRAIVVYKNGKKNDTAIASKAHIAEPGRGKHKLWNTYLDVLLSLLQFRHDNRHLFFYVLRNLHSGFNKINWTRTIASTSAIIEEDCPVYLHPVNKRKVVNLNEELLVIYYSILNYIGDTYGFPKETDCHFQLITGKQFETYLRGYGKVRLSQIRHKYFSDKNLRLWELCYAFFNEAREIRVSTERKDFLLAKDFYVVFEAIIDELIGEKELPDGMRKRQEDGKVVDHLFTAPSLVHNKHSRTYYLGDSKYYKIGHELSPESIYKQYTYARNVIQWNLDIFNDGGQPPSGVRLRDDVTEGYNIIPNFFVSATIDSDSFDYSDDGIAKTDRENNKHKQIQFKNRLFDRDTLLLFHYDVNFLYVVSLYARNNASQKAKWKRRVRELFRNEIQEWLQEDYDFYVMAARKGVNAREYIKSHFQDVLGKIFAPYTDRSVYSLALDKGFGEENERLLKQLRRHFHVVPCELGKSPLSALRLK